MARKWFVGYFYHGYLAQLLTSIEKHEELNDVTLHYPEMSEVVSKEGQKVIDKTPLFENYVLFEFEEESYIWKDILRLTPIIYFLKDEDTNKPLPMTDDEVTWVDKMTTEKFIKDYSSLIGKNCNIIKGPFKNFSCYCKAIVKSRNTAKVIIDLFNVVEREVEINLELLEEQ